MCLVLDMSISMVMGTVAVDLVVLLAFVGHASANGGMFVNCRRFCVPRSSFVDVRRSGVR